MHRDQAVETAETPGMHRHAQAKPEPAPTAIIGLGNEIAGDDGVGIWVARELQRILEDRPDIEVIPLPWAGFALLDALAGRDRAAIIDCLCTGTLAPGTIVRLDESDFRGSVRLNSFHDINYPTVLALARTMGVKIPEKIAIWGIEGQVMDVFTESLSPAVRASLEEIVNNVLAFLDLNKQTLKADKRPFYFG